MCKIKIINASKDVALKDDTVVWRYMGFDKFISFIATEELYFSRLTTLQDKEEMMLPAFNELRKLEQWQTDEGCQQVYAQTEEKCQQIIRCLNDRIR